MLFNSYAFILGFLPVTFFVFFAVARKSHRAAAGWLALVSFFFYGWWSPRSSCCSRSRSLVNFDVGEGIQRLLRPGQPRRAHACSCPASLNLLLLGYFKYANFFVAT